MLPPSLSSRLRRGRLDLPPIPPGDGEARARRSLALREAMPRAGVTGSTLTGDLTYTDPRTGRRQRITLTTSLNLAGAVLRREGWKP